MMRTKKRCDENNVVPFVYVCTNTGIRFDCARSDLRGEIKISSAWNTPYSQAELLTSVAEMTWFHLSEVYPGLNGFAGYDCLRFVESPNNRNKQILRSAIESLAEYHDDLNDDELAEQLTANIEVPNSGNDQADYETTKNLIEAALEKYLEELDNVVYFQPERAGDPDCGTSAANILSFQVYRSEENAKKAHPDCRIWRYTGHDIDEPKYLD